MTLTTDDGTTLAVHRSGEGRPILLVHGWMTSGSVWRSCARNLERSFECVIPDLRGTGASSCPPGGYTLERISRDLVQVVEQLDLHDVVVVGHSMGGQLAHGVALGVPDRVSAMVLLNPVPLAGLSLPEDVRALFRGCAGNCASLNAILDAACLDLTEDDRARLLELALPISSGCMADTFDAWTAGAFGERVAELTIPALVVATDDPFLPPAFLDEAVAQRLPCAQVAYLPGPGHYLPVERPGAAAALIQAFAAGLHSEVPALAAV